MWKLEIPTVRKVLIENELDLGNHINLKNAEHQREFGR